MAQRSYQEGCLAAHALDLVGDRWTLLIVRELMIVPKRFSVIRAGLPGISANVLTQKLTEMTASGLLGAQTAPAPGAVQVYALTAAGRALYPVLAALCRWGAAQPGHDPRLPISPSSILLSMQILADRSLLPEAEIGFALGRERLRASVAPGHFELSARGGWAGVTLTTTPNWLAALAYGGVPPALLEQQGALTIEGDRTPLEALFGAVRTGARAAGMIVAG